LVNYARRHPECQFDLVTEAGVDPATGQTDQLAGETPEDGGGRGIIALAQAFHQFLERSVPGHGKTLSPSISGTLTK
jgi:hypothetical protein